jgi:hypothetical protein
VSGSSSRSGYAPGYFDDHSMLRRVHRERVIGLVGPRALLMQAAHPLAVAGLLAHSSALDEPYDRLARTAQVMHAIGFGTREEANEAARRVRAMHRRVRGRLPAAVGRYPAGTPYRADDPELLMWILFTLVDSGIVVYRRYVGSLSRDRGGVQQTAPAERPPAEPIPPAERPPAEPGEPVHDDQQIRMEIQQQIQLDEMLSALQIQVQVEDGVVTLTGEVETEEESQRIETLVLQTQGVVNVHNELEVAVPNQEPY